MVIHRRIALNSRRLRDQVQELGGLVSEIVADYATAHNRMLLDSLLEREAEAHALPIAETGIKPFKLDTWMSHAPSDLPPYNFAEAFAQFSFNTFLTRPEAVACNIKVAVECSRATRLQLFSVNITKSVRADEFEQVQLAASDATFSQLREAWSVTLRQTVKTAFKDAGKGAYNLKEKDFDGYDVSKLRRFLTAARFRQEDALRNLVESSCHRLVNFLERRLVPPARIVSPANVELHPAEDLSDLGLKKSTAAVFQLEVAVTPQGVFQYTVDPQAFVAAVMSSFDAGLSKVAALPQLASCVMDSLQWSPTPLIKAPKLEDPVIAALRERLYAAISKAVEPLKEYIALYAQFTPVLTMDAKAYIAGIEANEELTLNDLRKELAIHTKERDNIVANVPQGVCVGGFQVDCSKVLTVLLAKKDFILDQLKGVLARKPAAICERVATKFKEMDRAIQAKSTDPETLKAQRDLIHGVGKFCAEMLATLSEATPFFEAMEDMRLVMSETAVEAKAAAQFWPNRIRNTVFNVEESHAADEQRYKAELKESQQAFERTLVDLQTSVTNLQNNTDLSAVAATHAQARAHTAR